LQYGSLDIETLNILASIVVQSNSVPRLFTQVRRDGQKGPGTDSTYYGLIWFLILTLERYLPLQHLLTKPRASYVTVICPYTSHGRTGQLVSGSADQRNKSFARQAQTVVEEQL
jgi:hypothetical protein